MAALRRHGMSFAKFLQRSSVSMSIQRHLLSAEILGIDGYERQRVIVNDRLGPLKDGFLERMRTDLSTPEQQIFTEDLKTMVHIARADDEIEILVAMMKRYLDAVGQSGGTVTRFNFGPPLMRLMYLTKQTDKALALFKDEALSSVFSNLASYKLLMDLLYESERYQEVIDVFSHSTGHPDNLAKSVDCTTVFFAALYKMNTESALELAVQQLKKMQAESIEPRNRVVIFAASLALSQNQPSVALEICSNLQNFKSSVIQALKVVSYARLGRVEDTLPYFRSVLQDDSPDASRRMKVLPEAVSAVEEAMSTGNKLDLQQEVQSLRQSLEAAGLIIDDSLSNIAERPVTRGRSQFRDSFKTRMRAPIDGARSRGPGFRPGYRRTESNY